MGESLPRLEDRHQGCSLCRGSRPSADVAALLADCDCGVFPSRAEGWNLGLLECMSMGLNVIATNYSAHTEFVEPANCRVVQIDETEPQPAGELLGAPETGANWARPRWSRWSITCAKCTG